jgi:2-polyprenyl-3-methyl-5-hydroxy-6-metoxy-1,4-benzoquinol methylase
MDDRMTIWQPPRTESDGGRKNKGKSNVPNVAMEYTEKFFQRNMRRTEQAVKVFSNFIMDYIGPNSVIDVGCGQGQYLAELKRLGARKIAGIDGSWIDQTQLLIPRDKFYQRDLRHKIEWVEGPFDLAICLETAEHIEKEYADTLIGSLAGLSVLSINSLPKLPLSHSLPERYYYHH